MDQPKCVGFSHVCIVVDKLTDALEYYQRILGAVPDRCFPRFRNKGFFQAAGFVGSAEKGEASIAFLTVPGAGLTLELMEFHRPAGRRDPIVFGANDVSGARHLALRVENIEEAFDFIKAQPDALLISQTSDYQVYQVSPTRPEAFYYFDPDREADTREKRAAADALGRVRFFCFIDKYGLQWELEQDCAEG